MTLWAKKKLSLDAWAVLLAFAIVLLVCVGSKIPW